MIVRSLFIVSLLLWVVALDELLPIFLLTIYSVLVLFVQGFKIAYMLKSLRLLMWLFIPIMLFHGLFTPGRLIQQPMYIPLSIEGLERGLYLSAHITLIFFCALLVFRVFTTQEWVYLINKLPKSEPLKTYLVLLAALKDEVTNVLKQEKKQWSEQGKLWSNLPQLLVDSIQKVFLSAKREAKNLWKNWDNRMDIQSESTLSLWSSKEFMYAGMMALGWSLFWMG